MSAAITSGQDLLASAKLPELPSLFTTFAAGHFVKAAVATQPVAVKTFSYTEVFAAAPLDLDYDEPNAVVEQELELVSPGSPVHHLELAVKSSQPAESPKATVRIAA
jgi:hypothetical protein